MLDALSKRLFHLLADSRGLKTLASTYGMRKDTSFARRFIAGESTIEAIAAARTLEARGLRVCLSPLGERVTSPAEAQQGTQDYRRAMDAIVAAGIERNVSVTLTQLGLDVDRATATDNLRRILDVAQRHEFFVRVDMENSPYTDVTLDVCETMWRLGYRHLGVALQAALRRTEDDLRRVSRLGARIRLVKGAFKESRQIAFAARSDVDAAYVRLMRMLLVDGTYPAIATHDSKMIHATKAWAAEQRVPPDRYEFQMLYGVRRDLQAALVAEGYRVRVFIPFGPAWFPYFMHRLGERPANVAFVLRSLLRER